jgi:hypothetical protein
MVCDLTALLHPVEQCLFTSQRVNSGLADCYKLAGLFRYKLRTLSF